MFQKLEEIKTQYPTHRWVFLTLTVRNCDLVDLRDTLKDMNASWKRMSETVAFKKGVAGFINNRSNQGKGWRHASTSPLSRPIVG